MDDKHELARLTEIEHRLIAAISEAKTDLDDIGEYIQNMKGNVSRRLIDEADYRQEFHTDLLGILQGKPKTQIVPRDASIVDDIPF